MRADFEAQLHTARSEVAKAQVRWLINPGARRIPPAVRHAHSAQVCRDEKYVYVCKLHGVPSGNQPCPQGGQYPGLGC
jgi:hypothetical protein